MAALRGQVVAALAEPVLKLKRPWVMRLPADDAVHQRGGVQPRELGSGVACEAGVPRHPMVGEAADRRPVGTPRLDEGPGPEEGDAAVLDQLCEGIPLEDAIAQLLREQPCCGGLGGPGVPGDGEDRAAGR